MTPTMPAAAILLGLLFAAPARASDPAASSDPAAPSGTVHRLSPEEIKRILAKAAEKPPLTTEGVQPSNKIHGEMGVMVGTGGARALYGSAVVPLGDQGVAAFSFETGRYPGCDRRSYRGMHEPF